MNNALEIALNRVFYSIPKELLEMAFLRELQNGSLAIDQAILTKVVRGRVMIDCNLHGGKHKRVILRQDYVEQVDYSIGDSVINFGRWGLYRIPVGEREGLPIVEVMSVSYPFAHGGISAPPVWNHGAGATLTSIANAVLDSHTFAQVPPRPIPELLGGDLVRLNPAPHSHIDWVLNVRLSYDQEFTNLNTSAMETFAEMVLAATKHYIYNTLVIEIDRAAVEAGTDIGVFKEILDSYAEAAERYNELKAEFAGGAVLDPNRLRTILQYTL